MRRSQSSPLPFKWSRNDERMKIARLSPRCYVAAANSQVKVTFGSHAQKSGKTLISYSEDDSPCRCCLKVG